MDQPQQSLLCPTHITYYIVVGVVGIALGALAGWFLTYEYFEVYAPPVHESDYKAGFDDAKKRVEESAQSGVMISPTHDDIRTISGTVTVVKNDEIYFHTQLATPLDFGLEDRGTYITANTKIFKISKKDPKVFQAEMDAFMKAAQSNKTATSTVKPPESFVRTSSDISSIKVGDTIEVTATENIKTKKEFTAGEVLQLQSKPVNN